MSRTTNTISSTPTNGTLANGTLAIGTLANGTLATALLLAIGALAAPAFPVAAHADDAGAEIVATVSGLRSTEGVVRIALYGEDGWLSHDRTLASCVAHVHGESASCSLGHHAPGAYAIALLHDEDGDGDMDTDFFGLPQEGYGFSSGARPGLGAPSFGDASFTHGGDRTVAAIRARYGI